MSCWALVPVKSFANSKSRLSAVFGPRSRSELAMAMTTDVLAALSHTSGLNGVAIVTCDPAAIDLARPYGAKIVHEDRPLGYSAAVRTGQHALARLGARTILILPIDVPLVAARDIEQVLKMHAREAPAVTLVPSSSGLGTNCLVASPPTCMTPAFGIDSFRRHQRIARARKIEPKVALIPAISLDIDLPEDLKLFMEKQGGMNTRDYLRSSVSDDERAQLEIVP